MMVVSSLLVMVVVAALVGDVENGKGGRSAVMAVAAASTRPHYDSPAINCCLAGDVIIPRPSRSVPHKISDA